MVTEVKPIKTKKYVSTRNACKLCAPLGAGLVFRGIRNTMPLLHGSQGCATYIRRYLISHFKEPVDISSSNFSEDTAIFGGSDNLKTALNNVIRQYEPDLIGIASTCLSETIGDDVPGILREFKEENKAACLPAVISVSTPSYCGTHIDGFHQAVKAVVVQMAKQLEANENQIMINLFPGMASAEDLRYLKQVLDDFCRPYVMLPDYSETLDGPSWKEYQKIPVGGTALEEIEKMGNSRASIEFGAVLKEQESAGKVLQEQFKVPLYPLGLPIGVKGTDQFFRILETITGKQIPEKYRSERGRLLDAYADAHKHVFEKRAVIYGEEDLVIGLAMFLREIGMLPIVCASGSQSGFFEAKLRQGIPDIDSLGIVVRSGVDFMEIEEEAQKAKPDMLIGNSKGYSLSGKLGIPLMRAGFPIHDRIGGQRIQHYGYRGAQQLFDGITNTLIDQKQSQSKVGYTYM